jgi:two-component sensor histidine kinase
LLFYWSSAIRQPLHAQVPDTGKALPPVILTQFKVLNQYLPMDSLLKRNRVELSYNHNTFSIAFQAPGLPRHDTFVYRYKLVGAETDWMQAAEPLIVNYTLVQPGSYTFLVQVQSKNGTLSSAVTELPIIILLPFWLSWWFIILCCLLFAGIIYYFHRQSVNRILAIEAIRQKVARDLHDDMGSTLSTINILSMMAKSKLGEDPVKTGEFLTKISDNSSRMMEAMDDIVWSINPANDSMDKTIARMRSFATEVLEAREIDLEFGISEAVNHIYLDMEQRRDFFLIYKEAINNTAKYSHCKQVRIALTVAQQTLRLKIEDDGVGFDVNAADSGNGLNNMRKRAENLGGTFTISSRPLHGTRICLEMRIT